MSVHPIILTISKSCRICYKKTHIMTKFLTAYNRIYVLSFIQASVCCPNSKYASIACTVYYTNTLRVTFARTFCCAHTLHLCFARTICHTNMLRVFLTNFSLRPYHKSMHALFTHPASIMSAAFLPDDQPFGPFQA